LRRLSRSGWRQDAVPLDAVASQRAVHDTDRGSESQRAHRRLEICQARELILVLRTQIGNLRYSTARARQAARALSATRTPRPARREAISEMKPMAGG